MSKLLSLLPHIKPIHAVLGLLTTAIFISENSLDSGQPMEGNDSSPTTTSGCLAISPLDRSTEIDATQSMTQYMSPTKEISWVTNSNFTFYGCGIICCKDEKN